MSRNKNVCKSHVAAVIKIAATLNLPEEQVENVINHFFNGPDGYFAYLRQHDNEFEIPYIGSGTLNRSKESTEAEKRKKALEKGTTILKEASEKIEKPKKKQLNCSIEEDIIKHILKMNRKAAKESARIEVGHKKRMMMDLPKWNKAKRRRVSEKRKNRTISEKKYGYTYEQFKEWNKEEKKMNAYKKKLKKRLGTRPVGRPPKNKLKKPLA